jgi:adenylosuccinate synthase
MQRGAIVIGLLFGDEAKGGTVDFLCSERHVDYVIRFSGGPQTAHNVVTDDGKHHTFSQFGSGTFQGAKTILSEHVLVNPFNMAVEADHLESLIGKDPFAGAFISENALLITPIHVEANRQREINRGSDAHGSCGEGIGETMDYALNHAGELGALRIGDLKGDKSILTSKLDALKDYLEADVPEFVFSGRIDALISSYDLFLSDRNFQIVEDDWILKEIKDVENYNIFEGSQGVLLDEDFGFHPHTTWSSVTDANALRLIRRAGAKIAYYRRIGVTRTYTTRHGYGPFPSEFEGQEWRKSYPENHNAYGRFQGAWRAGLLDLPLLEYAVHVNRGLDEISLSHCDIPVKEVVTGYEGLSVLKPSETVDLDYQESLTALLNEVKGKQKISPVDGYEELMKMITDYTGARVSIISSGPAAKDKVFFRR